MSLPTIVFIDVNEENIKEFKRQFKGVKNVEFFVDDIRNTKCDCIVSPANSFGMMDGGVDLFIEQMLHIEKKLCKQIKLEHFGEQHVGSMTMVKVDGHPIVKWMASVPTMRLPEDVSETHNAYIAFRTLLVYLKKNKTGIKRVACTPFCTGAGHMPVEVSARQMYLAYKSVMEARYPDWAAAYQAQNDLKFTI